MHRRHTHKYILLERERQREMAKGSIVFTFKCNPINKVEALK